MLDRQHCHELAVTSYTSPCRDIPFLDAALLWSNGRAYLLVIPIEQLLMPMRRIHHSVHRGEVYPAYALLAGVAQQSNLGEERIQ